MPDEKYLIPEPPKSETRESRPHPIRVRLDVIALIVAGIGGLFSFLQWTAAQKQADIAEHALSEARRAADEQAKDVQRASKAAEYSADGARTLADVAQKSLSISERGAHATEQSAQTAKESLATTRLLFAEGRRAELSRTMTVMRQLEAGKPIKYDVTFLNTRPTRAINVTTITSPLSLPVNQPIPSDPGYKMEGPPTTSTVLPHEHIVQYGEGAIVPTAVFEGAQSGSVRVYVYGKIEYDDADGGHHLTKFCDYYVPGVPTLTACGVHNSAN